jgi:cytochrome c-type biogenesis protein CcmF
MDRLSADGNGLNPLLQYPEMVIHPPMLYLGWVGFSVPFAFALGALIMKYPGEKWISITRRWTMVTWLFLTCGILLGMHWSYAVLGWGGYWMWDPVENASILPWLTGTAFLHSVMMQEKRGMMKTWNVWLVFTTFMLSILGTFLTRSGVVSSVHSFAESNIGTWFVGDPTRFIPGFLPIVLLVCLFFYIKNRRHLKAENKLEALVSRESSFMFNNLLLLAACFAVLWGTLFPIISEWVKGQKIAVGLPFFNNVNLPAGLFLLFLTALGPLLAWRKTSWASIRKNFAIPAAFSVLTIIVLMALGMRPWVDAAHFYALTAFALGMLVITTITLEFIRGGRVLQGKLHANLLAAMLHLLRRNTRRYGGYIVHFGIAVIFIGFAGSAFDKDTEQPLAPGQKMQIGDYTLVSQDATIDDNANYKSYATTLDVYKGGKKIANLYPELRTFHISGRPDNEGQPDHIVANHSTFKEDLYVIYASPTQERVPVIKAMVKPLVVWVWIGWLVVVLGTVVALVPNAAPLRSPVAVAVSAPVFESKEMHPAGAVK